MEFVTFRGVVNHAIKNTNEDILPIFKTDGRNFFAYCDGVKFTSSMRNDVITVKWGAGHQAVIRA